MLAKVDFNQAPYKAEMVAGAINNFVHPLSLDPILYLDLLDVNAGYFTDISGYNHVVKASKTVNTNDTIQFAANDTTIINALKAANCYYFFYTDDNTPLAKRVEDLNGHNGRQLIYINIYHIFAIYATPLSDANIINVYKYCQEQLLNPFACNIIKGLSFPSIVSQNIIEVPTGNRGYYEVTIDPTLVETTNTLPFSITKKTLTRTIATPAAVNVIARIYGIYSIFNRFTWGCWINTDGFNGYQLAMYGTDVIRGNISSAALTYNTLKVVGNKVNTANYVIDIVETSGTWSYIRIKFYVERGVSTNYLIANGSLYIGLYGTTPANHTIEMADINLVNDYVALTGSNYASYPSMYDTNTHYVGKKFCTIGDSISVGAYMEFAWKYLGFAYNYNCSRSGSRYNYVTSNIYAYYYRDTFIAQPADYFIITFGANDANSTIGTISDTTCNQSYLGGANQLIDYMITNVPNAKFIMMTALPIIGGGNTLAQGKALYEQVFIDMANGIKQIAANKGVYCLDLHGSGVMTWDNAHLLLADNVHWTITLHQLVGKYIAKWLIENNI